MYSEELKSLQLQLFEIEEHLKWCEDNNKPKEQLDLHRKVINDIKEEMNQLQKQKDEPTTNP